MITRASALALFLIATLGAGAGAHEVRPAYLELRETGPETLDVLWKVPARGDLTLALVPVFPHACSEVAPARAWRAGGAAIESYGIRCAGGLFGHEIGVEGLSATMTDVLVRVQWLDDQTQVVRLTPAAPSFVVEAAPGVLEVATTYLGLGIEHILLGIDHLLFVLGLLLIVRDRWTLVKTITAFTLAHSITLAAATLGFVQVQSAPVEAVIALSIVFLASELARLHRGDVGLTARHPWLVAFSFGLLHGFGFAGALAEIGLPQTDIPLALFVFNLGVEAGQLLFVAGVLALLWLGRRVVASPPRWLQGAPAYAIGSLTAFWVIERVLAFG